MVINPVPFLLTLTYIIKKTDHENTENYQLRNTVKSKTHLLVFFHDFLCLGVLESSFGFQFINKPGLKLTQRLLLHSNLRDLFRRGREI